jgi:hypothetical protein
MPGDPTRRTSGLVRIAAVRHAHPVVAADRRRALEARVYGRDPDPAAVSALRELLEPPDAPPDPVMLPARRPMPRRALGVSALAAVLLGSAAWGIGAIGGPTAMVAHPSPSAATDPITVFTASGSGTTTVVDAATGQVLAQTGPLHSCDPSALEHPADPLCRAAAAFRQGGVARAQQAKAASEATTAPTPDSR